MPNQKRVFIIHGRSATPQSDWLSWLAENLRKRGFSAEAPEMPDTNNPKIKEWISRMQLVIKKPDKDTILVGHSLGGQAVLRYLVELPEGIQIRKAVLIAPVVDKIKNLSQEEETISGLWLKTPIDAEKARKSAKEIIAFFSDNDQWIPLSSEKILRKNFGARTIIEHDMGHYSDDENMNKVPRILEEIVK